MIVVKVGGSLYDLPSLAGRLGRFLGTLGDPDWVLVPGGGATADVIRDFDRNQGLGPETSHWLALRACTVNAHFLAHILPGTRLVVTPTLARGGCILDSFAFVQADDGSPGSLPHTWDATSDAVAARAAIVCGAPLVLLKSVSISEPYDWDEASRAEQVDPLFAGLVRRSGIEVRAVNLRLWQG